MCFAVFLIGVEFTATNIALVTMQREFDCGLSTLQWIVNAYLLTFCAFMVPGGRLGDLYGHRKMVILGAVIFGLSSAVGGAAPGSTFVVISRLFQGVGAALLWPSVMTVIFKALPAEKKGFAIGSVMGTAGFAMAIGPVLGAFFAEELSWRWIFFCNVPLVGVIVLLARRFVPVEEATSKESIDYVGGGILTVGLIGLVIALDQANIWGWGSLKTLLVLSIACVLYVVFLFVEKKVKDPILGPDMLRDRVFVLTLIARGCNFFGWFALLFILGLYFQHARGLSAMETGLFFVPLTLSFGLVSPFGGRIIDKVGAKIPTLVGLTLLALGFFWLSFFTVQSSNLFFVTPLLMIGTGQGFVSSGLAVLAIGTMEEKKSGLASAVYFMVTLVGGIVGVAICGYFLGELASLTTLNAAQQETFLQSFILSMYLCAVLNVAGFFAAWRAYGVWERFKAEGASGGGRT
jgi:DHA2 family methylenomycin A resistance protein-like MFS transporter